MKIGCTKLFARFINNVAKELGFECKATCVKVCQNTYRYEVSSDVFAAMEYGDYDPSTGLFKVIVLRYPDDYYAMPRFLTTRELTKEVLRRGLVNVSIGELKPMIRELCEV